MDEPLNLFEYEELARARLPRMAWEYYAGGAHDELTLRANRRAWERLRLFYRVLVDVSRRSLATQVLGRAVSMPVLVAPTAFHRLACPEGELASARAAAAAGTVFVLSTLSNTPMEEVIAAFRTVREGAGQHPGCGAVWFQLYVYRDRAVTEALVRRAEAAGAEALVVTVDSPLLGVRERDVRNRFCLPEGLSVANLGPAGMDRLVPRAHGSALAAYIAALYEQALSWRDLEWLAGLSRLPVVLKGLVRADDAVRAVEHGARAVVVSNHGGRQLDTAPATAEALPAIARAVGDRAEIYVDGGVRRGTDVLKALALGARAVLIGRPVLWGLAVGAEAGARRVLELLRQELDLGLALVGCPDVRELGAELLG
ncbi:MAG: alpha-hydroxy-acid oxidizing enzyme [Planctomycetota bacterium]|nr:MAG: alpha-hydroxy-acid oxidizing enzyme [Planctomycetota bacterium]